MKWFYLAIFGVMVSGSIVEEECYDGKQPSGSCTDLWYEDQLAKDLFEVVRQERCRYAEIPHQVELALQGTAQEHVKNLLDHLGIQYCPYGGFYRWNEDDYRRKSCCANPDDNNSLEKCTFMMPKCLYRDSNYVQGGTEEIVLYSDTPLSDEGLVKFLYKEISTDDVLASLLRDMKYTHIGVAGKESFIAIYLSGYLGTDLCHECYCAATTTTEPTVTGPATITYFTTEGTATVTIDPTVTYFTEGTATVTIDPTVTYFTTEEIITVTGPATITYFTTEGTATVTIDPTVTYFTEGTATVTIAPTITYFTTEGTATVTIDPTVTYFTTEGTATVTIAPTITYFTTEGTATVTIDPTVTYFTTEEIITVTGPATITYFTTEGTATVTIDPTVTYFTTEGTATVTIDPTVTYFTDPVTCPTCECTTTPYCIPTTTPCIPPTDEPTVGFLRKLLRV